MTLLERDEMMREEGRREVREEGWRESFEEGWREGFEEGWREGFEEGWREGFEEGRREGLEEVIIKFVKVLLEMDMPVEEIKNKIVTTYSISQDKAEEYLKAVTSVSPAE